MWQDIHGGLLAMGPQRLAMVLAHISPVAIRVKVWGEGKDIKFTSKDYWEKLLYKKLKGSPCH